MSRGLRNNNPGNLRLSKDKWKGLRPVQADKDFFQFVDMPHGYRAMLITLQNYRRKHGCRSVASIIKRYGTGYGKQHFQLPVKGMQRIAGAYHLRAGCGGQTSDVCVGSSHEPSGERSTGNDARH